MNGVLKQINLNDIAEALRGSFSSISIFNFVLSK